jgi:hypothetical protein
MRRISFLLVALACGLATALALTRPESSTADPPAAPVFSSSDGAIVFDFVLVGTTAPAKTATIQNTGNAALRFGAITVVGRHAADFKVSSDSCTGATLAPRATCQLSITFTPSAAGTRIAAVRLTDNTPCDNWLTLAGSGTDTTIPATARTATCDGSVNGALQNASTTVTTTTGTTTTPSATAPVTGSSSVVRFPKSATCASRRTVTLHLRAPRGTTFTRVRVVLGGRVVKTLAGRRIATSISLRGLPRGRFTLQVKATVSGGRHITKTRHYVTCVAAKP